MRACKHTKQACYCASCQEQGSAETYVVGEKGDLNRVEGIVVAVKMVLV